MRCPRSEVFDPKRVNVVHVHNRTVRRCWLLGEDPHSGQNFDHRKDWIEERIHHFAAHFGIDVLAYAIRSNHFHLLLRTRPDVVASWDDREVARRWLMICPIRKDSQGQPLPPTEKEIQSITGCPIKLEERRLRLADPSWWMRLLCQKVAMRANREECEVGRFWQDRFRATLILDKASLLACSAYVDLNLIRGEICQSLPESEHTSIQHRMAELADSAAEEQAEGADEQPPTPSEPPKAAAFLSPVPLNECGESGGHRGSATSLRCSDSGFLPMSLGDYIELLEWTARQRVSDESGDPDQESSDQASPDDTSDATPSCLLRLGLSRSDWLELTSDFGRLFSSVAGRCKRVDQFRGHVQGRRFHLRRRARELMTPG